MPDHIADQHELPKTTTAGEIGEVPPTQVAEELIE